MARHIISLYNLIDIGVSIDINELTTEEAYYLEYYGTRRKIKDENNRFEILAKMLK